MEITKIGFPAVVADNELAYFQMLQTVIDSVDELSSMRVVRKPDMISFLLTPSEAVYTQQLLQEILSYHTMMGFKLRLSKSIRTTSTIAFDLDLPAT